MADLTLADLERLETLARKYLQPEYITSDNLYTEPEPIYEIKSKEPAPNYSGQQWLFTAYQNETAELLVHLLNLTPQLIAAARECDALKAELETTKRERDAFYEEALQQALFVTELYEHHKITAAELREFYELRPKNKKLQTVGHVDHGRTSLTIAIMSTQEPAPEGE